MLTRERERERAIHIAVQTFGYGWLFVSEGVGEENPITFDILVDSSLKSNGLNELWQVKCGQAFHLIQHFITSKLHIYEKT